MFLPLFFVFFVVQMVQMAFYRGLISMGLEYTGFGRMSNQHNRR